MVSDPLLQVSELRTEIRLKNATVRAVDGVSLAVRAGECLGVVGESGCGKTMTVRSIMRLLPFGGVITSGSIRLAGIELTELGEPAMQTVRGNEIGMVFQDPSSCLDPTMTIGRQIGESVILHKGADRRAAADRAVEMLGLVGVSEPERVAAQYPRELSGGMCQRAMIAAALACEPKVLIADEPTTSLDVTVQRDILELLDDLREQLGMAVILVTHDLGVMAGHADQLAIMYAGRIVEHAATSAVLASPRHPYTEALFSAAPELATVGKPLYSIPGRPPDLVAQLSGCGFAPRCRYARDWCTSHEPALDGDHPGHAYACFFPISETDGDPADGQSADAALGGRQLPAPGMAAGSEGMAAGSEGMAAGSAGKAGSAGTAARSAGRAAGSAEGAGPLLTAAGLVKDYPVKGGLLRRRVGAISAVAGVSFELAAGRTFGLVGESGSGKTTVAKLLVGLERPDAGSVVFRGTDLARLSPRQRRPFAPGIQLMFQDSYASLDPRMRIRSILREPLAIQKTAGRRRQRREVSRLLDEVGLSADAAGRFPREFSGGQRQRLALARALIQRPALIVADEPVSALDVSVQAQILNLMRKLQRQYGLSYLFISHDLSVVRYMADTIGVMYLGKLVEVGPAEEVCAQPAHHYTRSLIDAVPTVTGARTAKATPSGGQPGVGERPTAVAPPSGCRFRTRCAFAADVCTEQEPPLRAEPGSGRLVACHFPLTRVGQAPLTDPSSELA